eukprot:365123-Chlamydomonas_euryale.AAC.43
MQSAFRKTLALAWQRGKGGGLGGKEGLRREKACATPVVKRRNTTKISATMDDREYHFLPVSTHDREFHFLPVSTHVQRDNKRPRGTATPWARIRVRQRCGRRCF